MTPEERSKIIESYGMAYQALLAALQRFPKEMWQFKPAPDAWSIHEMIVHIADSEVSSYIRCRRLIVEPGSIVVGYDQDKWAQELDYHSQSAEDALELFKYLRNSSYLLIQDLPAATWSNTVEHTERGTLSMDDWLKIYEHHIPAHIEQMQANYDVWQKQRKG
jgi:hypothetical protein